MLGKRLLPVHQLPLFGGIRDAALATQAMFTLSMTDVCKTVREWQVCLEQLGVSAEAIDKLAPAVRHVDDVSTPELRKLLP